MGQVAINKAAPDFALKDYRGNLVRLSDYLDERYVLLVFNRGFT